jgi:hypothetical protein
MPIAAEHNSVYDEITSTTKRNTAPENIMMRLFPLTWAALHLGLASAATYLLISSDVLADAAIFLIH